MPVMHGYAKDPDGTVNELYWIHLMEYEQTRLRGLFLEEMRRIEPSWVQTHDDSKAQADLEFAVDICNGGLGTSRIRKWLDDLEQNVSAKSLRQRFCE